MFRRCFQINAFLSALMGLFSAVLAEVLPGLRGKKPVARSGYGLALIMIFLVSSMMMAASLQIMNSTGAGRFLTTSLSHTSAQYVAETGLQVVINDIMTQLNAGNTVTTAYTYSGSVTMPNDPTNLGGTSSTVGTYTATMTAARGNSYLVKVTATVNGMQASVSKLLHMTRTTTAYILDEVPNATAAYGLRRLREGYTANKAIRVRRSSDNTEQDIGFESNGDLDTAALTSFVGTGVITPPLDSVGSAVAAYGLRKLREAYAGSAIRVRRSSDSTEQDIGFDGDGNLDTSALLTFVGSGSGYVKTWYDQSGNARDITMTTTTQQPRIVNAGSVHVINSKPTLYFDGSNDFLSRAASTNYPTSNSARTMNAVYKSATGSSGSYNILGWGSLSSGQNNMMTLAFDTSPAGMAFVGYNSSYNLFTSEGYDTSQHVGTIKYNGSTMYVYVDSALGGSKSITLSTPSSTTFYVGKGSSDTTYNFYGYISEVIIYASMLSAGNQTTLESNQDQYYISGGSANGYVTTWYDQSGNGRNATQSTASYQPLIVSSGSVVTMSGANKPTMQFDGSDDYLVTATSTAWPSGNTSRTMNAVFQNADPAVRSNLVAWGVYSTQDQSVLTYTTSSNGLGFIGFGASYNCTTTLGNDTLSHVNVITFDGSSVGVYQDGVTGNTCAMSLTTTSNTPLYLGINVDNSNPAKGKISEAIVYSSALSNGDRTTLETSQADYY